MSFIKSININNRRTVAVLGLKLFFCAFFFSVILSVSMISTAMASELGETEIFLIDSSYDSDERLEIQADLKKINSNAYFYVENNYYDELSNSLKKEFDLNLNSLAKDFDSVIYPEMKKTFGSEWSPGIDNDSRITILFTKTKENIGGYFNPSDEYKKDEIAGGKSNEREMIYLNINFIGDSRIKSFLAHEFQHMITWYRKTKLRNITDDIWLNESRSEYASTAIGYDDIYSSSNLSARVRNFKTDPIDSLVEWQNKIDDYSSVNLFAQYLADRFGKEIFERMIDNNKVGIQSINKALSDLYYKNDTFQSVFEDWTITNYVNGTSLNSKYSYQNENLNYENFHIQPENIYELHPNVKIDIGDSIKDWSSDYYEFKVTEKNCENASKIRINFKGQDSGSFSIPYVISYEDKTKEVSELSLDNKQDSDSYISCLDKSISSITIIPISHKETVNFGNNIDKYSFSISVKIIESNQYKNNSLLKSLRDSKVYLIEDMEKKWITSPAVFISNGYDWKDIVIVTDLELSIYQDGGNISNLNSKTDGNLLKGLGPEVYLIENTKKRWITNPAVFISRGYKWEDIIIIPDSELDVYSKGDDVI